MPSDQIVLPKVTNTEAIYTCLRELEAVTESVYKTGDEGFEAVMETLIDRDLYRAVTESMQISGAGSDPQLRSKVIGEMEAELKAIPVLNLQTAVQLSTKSIARIHEWARMNLADPVVVEISVDPEVLGGARITFRGRYADKSVQAKWPAVWEGASGQGPQPGGG